MAEQKISNVSPPSELPSFILQSTGGPSSPSKSENLKIEKPETTKSENENLESKFSPAIPYEKSQMIDSAQKLNLNESVPQADEISAQQELADALSPITQGKLFTKNSNTSQILFFFVFRWNCNIWMGKGLSQKWSAEGKKFCG